MTTTNQRAVEDSHLEGCGTDREPKMVRISENVHCDPCIAPIVKALNASGIETVASCCGHTHRPGNIALADGRELFIAKDYAEGRLFDSFFPTDINGDTTLRTPGWRPISEAPRDELILVGPTKRMGICAAMNHSRDGWVTETCSEWVSIYTPTHFMPLPPPPGER